LREERTIRDPVDIALVVGEAILAASGDYFVGGSLASSMQGHPRSTNDIDIVLSIPVGKIRAFVETLGADFEVDEVMLRDALLHGRSANIFHLPSVMKIDLFAVGPTPYDEIEFSRRQAIQVRPGQNLYVKTAEDTVLRKLLWYRMGGGVSERQWRDVVEVLQVGGEGLDRAYLDEWATRLALIPLLERARAEAGQPTG
jgi:hypothetical protein